MNLLFRISKLSVFLINGLCLYSSLGQSASYRVISDFDDTIKRSHISADHDSVGGTINGGARMIGRATLYQKIFSGVPELYKEFTENYRQQSGSQNSGLYVLSASPYLLVSSIIEESLEYGKIEYDKLFTRSLNEIFFGDKEEYKLSKIESVLEGNEDELILLGDDVEADPNVYKNIEEKYPERVASIYIRRIKNRDLPKGITGFFSVFEVAAIEFSNGRMNYIQVENIANAILDVDDEKMRRVIPYYAYCPKEMKEFTPVLNHELYKLEFLVQVKITDYCKNR